MKTLKYSEELVGIVHVKSNAIVFNETDIFVSVFSATDLDFCFGTGTSEFDCVCDKIDKHKLQHRRFTVDIGQLVNLPHNVPPFRLSQNLTN